MLQYLNPICWSSDSKNTVELFQKFIFFQDMWLNEFRRKILAFSALIPLVKVCFPTCKICNLRGKQGQSLDNYLHIFIAGSVRLVSMEFQLKIQESKDFLTHLSTQLQLRRKKTR